MAAGGFTDFLKGRRQSPPSSTLTPRIGGRSGDEGGGRVCPFRAPAAAASGRWRCRYLGGAPAPTHRAKVLSALPPLGLRPIDGHAAVPVERRWCREFRFAGVVGAREQAAVAVGPQTPSPSRSLVGDATQWVLECGDSQYWGTSRVVQIVRRSLSAPLPKPETNVCSV